MSFDNSTWTDIPLSTTRHIVSLGIVPLESFTTIIYARCSFPPQNVTVQNQTLTPTELVQSFSSEINFDPLTTPESQVINILLAVAIFAVTLQTLDFLTKKT